MLTFSAASTKDRLIATVLFCLMVAGAALTVADMNPFWFLVALWVLAMIIGVTSHSDIEITFSLTCLTVAALPFVIGLIGVPFWSGPFSMDTLGSKLLHSVSIFALCLVTSIYLGSHTAMCLNRPFMVGVSFMLYMAVFTILGPIGFYGDLIFQTSHLADLDMFMSNLIICSIIGLVLALTINRRFRRLAFFSAPASAKGGASP
ncbi:hypothetical protein [Methanomassiliicoccus luminyensis]|uniref:hypothetical protein n=1 Tax=Methanomassiliicoccus luminyensis TaxID=1080712 RepID=UPI0011CC3B94|nr:hypothetical protein [Methanomassiliicoccus luminyensis]